MDYPSYQSKSLLIFGSSLLFLGVDYSHHVLRCSGRRQLPPRRKTGWVLYSAKQRLLLSTRNVLEYSSITSVEASEYSNCHASAPVCTLHGRLQQAKIVLSTSHPLLQAFGRGIPLKY